MIEVKNLTKKYGDHVAVDDLSFTVEKGQIYGFLGPNGAGKTTTMSILTGCLAATSGDVLIDGHDIYLEPKKAKSLIGYLPEQPPLYPDMTPREYLCFVGSLKGIPKKELKEQVEQVMLKVQIVDVSERLIKNLSKGYKQRVGLAQAILGNPEIIILDEPTVGLDPVQIVEIRSVIKGLAEEHTVIFSSHILSEVSAICSHILIIANGKLIAEDTTENLEKRFTSSAVLELTVKGDRETVSEIIDSIPGVAEYSVSEPSEAGTVFVSVVNDEGMDVSEQLSYALLEQKCLILKMEMNRSTLEDVFMELVGSSADDMSANEEYYDDETGADNEMSVDADELLNGEVKSVWDEHMPDGGSSDDSDDAQQTDEASDEASEEVSEEVSEEATADDESEQDNGEEGGNSDGNL